jgi:hypothetical protein
MVVGLPASDGLLPLNHRVQIARVGKVHDNVQPLLPLEDVVRADNVEVLHLLHHRHLTQNMALVYPSVSGVLARSLP